MSFGTKENIEEMSTTATLDALEEALNDFNYEVVRTKMSISAKHGGIWSTNSHFSYITIVDMGEVRLCKDKETSQGFFSSPNTGVLATIIQKAENR
jgi:hypothetical protein